MPVYAYAANSSSKYLILLESLSGIQKMAPQGDFIPNMLFDHKVIHTTSPSAKDQ